MQSHQQDKGYQKESGKGQKQVVVFFDVIVPKN